MSALNVIVPLAVPALELLAPGQEPEKTCEASEPIAQVPWTVHVPTMSPPHAATFPQLAGGPELLLLLPHPAATTVVSATANPANKAFMESSSSPPASHGLRDAS
jgi:hypothetical protein